MEALPFIICAEEPASMIESEFVILTWSDPQYIPLDPLYVILAQCTLTQCAITLLGVEKYNPLSPTSDPKNEDG